MVMASAVGQTTEPLPARDAVAYYPHLDGVRAAAVIAVMIAHFYALPTIQKLGFGAIGVRIFFVLSGFLISRIILGYKLRGDRPGPAAAGFYWRRFLRLSPVFYIAIGVTSAIGLGSMRQDWLYHATYLTNFRVVFADHGVTGGHLWSLAVEEQFYLLWFGLLMLTRLRYLPHVIAIAFALGPLYRGALYFAGVDTHANWLLPGAIDSLAAGAWLAYAHALPSRASDKVLERLRHPAVFVSAMVGVVVIALPFAWDSLVKRVLYPVLVNLAAASMIAALVAREPVPLIYRWLALPPMRWIGRISYGIYVFHAFLPRVADAYFPGYLKDGSWTRAVALSAIAVILAAISWYGVERNVLRYKDAFARR